MNENIVSTQLSTMAKNLNMTNVDQSHLRQTLTNTVFKGANEEQLVTLMIVANQYKLNPFTKEIFAFPAKGGGITPVVSVDGWARIINDNPKCDGIQFEQDDESCTCKIYRKDRNHPTVVTEYLDECQGDIKDKYGNLTPWGKYPKRMLRHKALIQCARVAFGFSGIYDEDEAHRITASQQAVPATEAADHDYLAFCATQYEVMKIEARKGTDALSQAHANLLNMDIKPEYKKQFWAEHSGVLKETAQAADMSANTTIDAIEVEHEFIPT